MDTTIRSNAHLYHVDACVGQHALADTYRVYTLRRVRGVVKRRYYAALQSHVALDDEQRLMSSLQRSIESIPYPVHIEEHFVYKRKNYIVLAPGPAAESRSSIAGRFCNKGILIALLAIAIMIVLVWL